jgi:hypothetical protein
VSLSLSLERVRLTRWWHSQEQGSLPLSTVFLVSTPQLSRSSYLVRKLTDSLLGQNVSHGSAGESDIDKEFSSDQNPRFVLHDSQGFEPGEINNFGIVKDFINRRSNAERLEDRLHAIWYVFSKLLLVFELIGSSDHLQALCCNPSCRWSRI